MLHPVGKQAYKLKLSAKWKIHDKFHVSLLEQDNTKKGQELSVLEFKPGNDKAYAMEAIRDIAVYVKETDKHLPELYYLVAWKGYLEEETTWKSFLAAMHLQKMVSTFYKDHPEKPTSISASLNSAPPMTKPTI